MAFGINVLSFYFANSRTFPLPTLSPITHTHGNNRSSLLLSTHCISGTILNTSYAIIHLVFLTPHETGTERSYNRPKDTQLVRGGTRKPIFKPNWQVPACWPLAVTKLHDLFFTQPLLQPCSAITVP